MEITINELDIPVELIEDAISEYEANEKETVGMGGGCLAHSFNYDPFYCLATDFEGVNLPTEKELLIGFYTDDEHTELVCMIEKRRDS